MIYVFENGLLLTTTETWDDAEKLIKELQKDGHGTMEARNYIQPKPREEINYNRQPLPYYPMNCLHELLSPSWVNLSEEMRWRCNYGN